DVPLRSVVVHDPPDPAPATGDVFLAVGVESAAEAVRLGKAARAAAVLVRDEAGGAAAREGIAAGLAVLLVDPAVSWSQLLGVVYGLVLEGRETEAGRGPTELFAFADTLAGELGYPVTVEDQSSRGLAYPGPPPAAHPRPPAADPRRAVPPGVRGPVWR